MAGEDKPIVKEDEAHAHGPKMDPNKCGKSTTGEHVWNYSPRPDNQRLGICRYCEIQRIFPGAMIPTARPLPPPPMQQQAAPKIIPSKAPAPPAPSAISFEEKVQLSNASISKTAASIVKTVPVVSKVIVTPAKTVTAVRIIKVDQATMLPIKKITEKPVKQLANRVNVPFEERLKIVNEFLSGESGDKATVCKKYKVTKDTFDNWLKRQDYYRRAIERGSKSVHSETGKRTSVLKKLHQLEDLSVEEAIGVLKDWRDILHKDAVAARVKADELATRVTAIDIGIFKLVESSERNRQSIHDTVKKIAGAAK